MNNQVTIDGMTGTIQDNGMVRFGSDDRVNVLFYKKSILDPVKSREVGRPFHVSKDYVRIQQPGEKDYADRPVSDDPSVTARWPHHWARYQSGQQPAPNGTPLECLFPQNPEIAANLHTMAVHTVEQLANLTAHGSQTIGMGSAEWQKRAKEFLAAANGGAGMHKLQKQNEALQNKVEVQANQLALLQTQVERLLALQQGVPGAMVPNGGPTQAQRTAFVPQLASLVGRRQVFSNDGLADVELADAPDGTGEEYTAPESSEPLFNDPNEADGDAAASEVPVRRAGWPKGRPRKQAAEG